MAALDSSNPQPLIFGEVLFDCFPDHIETLGGAPFNVAWHLRGLGFDPLLVSAIGLDARGQRVKDTMSSWQLTLNGLQENPNYPTGAVRIELDKAGGHSFDICSDQAYDFVDFPQVLDSVKQQNFGLLYHGSLALRSTQSKQTLFDLRKHLNLPVFVDLNLRAPWWNSKIIEEAITGADWLKLNDEELAVVAGTNPADYRSFDSCLAAARIVKDKYCLQKLIVTRGDLGAFILEESDQPITAELKQPVEVVDTIGAGDSFSAIVIAGLLNKQHTETVLRTALEFAARICGIKGAVTTDRSVYRSVFGK